MSADMGGVSKSPCGAMFVWFWSTYGAYVESCPCTGPFIANPKIWNPMMWPSMKGRQRRRRNTQKGALRRVGLLYRRFENPPYSKDTPGDIEQISCASLPLLAKVAPMFTRSAAPGSPDRRRGSRASEAGGPPRLRPAASARRPGLALVPDQRRRVLLSGNGPARCARPIPPRRIVAQGQSGCARPEGHSGCRSAGR